MANACVPTVQMLPMGDRLWPLCADSSTNSKRRGAFGTDRWNRTDGQAGRTLSRGWGMKRES